MSDPKRYRNPFSGKTYVAHGLHELTPEERLTPKVLKQRAINRKKRKAKKGGR